MKPSMSRVIQLRCAGKVGLGATARPRSATVVITKNDNGRIGT